MLLAEICTQQANRYFCLRFPSSVNLMCRILFHCPYFRINTRYICLNNKWAGAEHFLQDCMCTQRRLKPAHPRSLISLRRELCITKTRPFKYIGNFTTKKKRNFQMKNSGNFHISALNIGCRYSLEPPRRGGSSEYLQSMFLSRNKNTNLYPCKPQFYCIKLGFKGVKTI